MQASGGGNNVNNGMISIAGSTYLRGMDNNNLSNNDNWEGESDLSASEDFTNCEERGEFVFENRAKYKG